MDIFEFTDRLCHKLDDMGISSKDCEEYIEAIKMTLSEEHIASATDADIEKAVNTCVTLYRKKHPEYTETTEEDRSDTLTFDLSNENCDESESFSPMDTIDFPEYEEAKPGARGIFMTVLITVLTSPLWAVAAILFILPFIVLFAIEMALTAVFIGLLSGGCAAGTAASLTGIVYGVAQMFSAPSIGLYEIGFGIILVGITLMFSVLAYNGAVRLMPFVFRKTGKLMGMLFSKIKPFLKGYARRCQGL